MRLNEYSAYKLHEVGEKIILAEIEGKVVGAAYLRNSSSSSIFKILRVYLPGIIKLIFPVLKAMNLRRIIKAGKSFKTDKIPADRYYTLEVIGVDKKYRGQGIARMLLEEAEKVVRTVENVEGIYLYTASKTTKDIYSHLGYQLIDKKLNDNLTIYHMFKQVS